MIVDPARRVRLMLLAAGMSSFLLIGLLQGVLGPAIPLFEKRFAIETATASWVLSAMGVGGFASLVGLYLLGARITPRLALSLMTLGAGGLAVAPSFLITVLGSLTFGLGFGSAAALFNQRVLLAFGARGAAMVSLLNASFSMGSILAPLVFLASGSRPEVVFTAAAFLAALTILIAGNGAPPAPQAADTAGATPARSRPFRLYPAILGFGLFGVGIEVTLSGLGVTGLLKAGLAPEEASRLLSAHFLALLIGRIGLTWFAGKLPGFAIFTTAVGSIAMLALGGALVDPGPFFVAMGFFAGMLFPGYFVTAAGKMGDDPRVGPVILGTVQFGVVSIPLIVARLLPLLGERGYFWILVGMAAVLTVLALANFRSMVAVRAD